VTIPAQIRREAGIEVGIPLVVAAEDGRVVIESREQLMQRLRREVAESWTGDPDTSVVDELIADRRAESATEDAQP
jgi:bifunctional DNA-binding transcriptional regulator/antitoxin component of YhaV-PrlF toxin-antitoxin module